MHTMKRTILIAGLVSISAAAFLSSAADAAPKKPAQAVGAAKQPELPTVLTGLPTNLTVHVLRCVRANVPEFGTNNVVVLQYRIKKIGPDTGPVKYYDDARFDAIKIKAKDASLGSGFEPIGGAGHEESTYSGGVDTSNWKVGQTGDGYAWFKIPERVTDIDVFFPKTSPVRLTIDVPRAK